jgi:uncharacterized membrane protein YsdA (DUF1294 family)
MTRSRRTLLGYSVVALLLTLAVAALLLAAVRPALSPAPLLVAWLVAVNLTTFAYYAYDKLKAQAVPQGARVPEAVLHGLAALGGSPGAYLGMAVLRHKTIKAAFRFVFWFTVVLQVLLIAALVYRILKGGD